MLGILKICFTGLIIYTNSLTFAGMIEMNGKNTNIAYDENKWESVLSFFEKQFGRQADLSGIIFIIGHRELGKFKTKFKKEEKQDLMHVGVCSLLSRAGYYNFVANDADGWPHYEYSRDRPKLDHEQQERLLKKMIIEYLQEEELVS